LSSQPAAALLVADPQIFNVQPLALAIADKTAAHFAALIAGIHGDIILHAGKINKLAVVDPQLLQ